MCLDCLIGVLTVLYVPSTTGGEDAWGEASERHVEVPAIALAPAGHALRLIESCITQLKAQGPSRTCNESKEEEGEEFRPSLSPLPKTL